MLRLRRGGKVTMVGSATGGILIVSLDFELYWGSRDERTLDQLRKTLEGTRLAVPRLLELFGKYGIHATWATVGLVCCDGKQEALRHAPRLQPAYHDIALSPYDHLARLPEDPATTALHFAPDLVRLIAQAPHQELATHTYSHYYCLEPGPSPDAFLEDLRSAIHVAERKFQRRVASLVFPRNQVDATALQACRDAGVIAYRGTERTWFQDARRQRDQRNPIRRLLRLADAYADLSGANTYPLPRSAEPPIDLPASRFLRPYTTLLRRLEPLRLRRISTALGAAARKGEVFHLWWHPENFGLHLEENCRFLEQVLQSYADLRQAHGMRSLTMGEVAADLLGLDRAQAPPAAS